MWWMKVEQECHKGGVEGGGEIDFRAEGEKESNQRRWRSDQHSRELHSTSVALGLLI